MIARTNPHAPYRIPQKHRKPSLFGRILAGLGITSLGILGILGIIALAFSGLFFTSWIAMLIIGGLHAEVFHSLPAYGYWVSVLIVFALGLIKHLLFGSRSKGNS